MTCKENCFYFYNGKCFKEEQMPKCNGICEKYSDRQEAEAQLEIAIQRNKAYHGLLNLEKKMKRQIKKEIEKINKRTERNDERI